MAKRFEPWSIPFEPWRIALVDEFPWRIDTKMTGVARENSSEWDLPLTEHRPLRTLVVCSFHGPNIHNRVHTVPKLYSEIIDSRATSPDRSWSDLKSVEPKLSVQDVSFFYGKNQALFDITLDIPDRAVTAFIGPSGCGKSTLLRMFNRMNDLIDSTRHIGQILMDGQDLNAPGMDLVDLRRRVGMVFQKSNPFPKSIYENVVYGPRIAGLRDRNRLEAITERCLKQAGLWTEVSDRLHHSALELSGGQQQRLCIARALATEPEVLLMDEPASALDPASTSRIEDLIFELRQHYTIVIVTHNMQQAARVSDQTAFFFQGRLIEVGPTETLFTKPTITKTEDYITGRFG